MINNQKVLALIPARGGSKGLPGKNIRNLNGKPLLAWTIESALRSDIVDTVILSSDDKGIIEVALRYGCEVPFVRSSFLSQDDTPGIEVVLDAIARCSGYDILVLLQPTSPLRTTKDMDEAILKMLEYESDFCVSVCLVKENPFWMYYANDNKVKPVIKNKEINRRQDLPDVFKLNGALYIGKTSEISKEKTFITKNTFPYIMPQERSIDIDTIDDFQLCVQLLKK